MSLRAAPGLVAALLMLLLLMQLSILSNFHKASANVLRPPIHHYHRTATLVSDSAEALQQLSASGSSSSSYNYCESPFMYEGDPLELPVQEITGIKIQDVYKLVLLLCHHRNSCVDLFESYLAYCYGITSLSAISIPNILLGFEVEEISKEVISYDHPPTSPTIKIGPAMKVTFTNGAETLQAYEGETALSATKRFCKETKVDDDTCYTILKSFIEIVVFDGHYHLSLPISRVNYRSNLNAHWTHIPYAGVAYKLADYWFPFIPVFDFRDKPTKYLEIGVLTGANALAVAYSYAAHPDSEIHLIDPWEEYDDYGEYKGFQVSSYEYFSENLRLQNDPLVVKKFAIHRGYSDKELIKLQDGYFDIIYIDGNHKPEYALEDAVLSFRKLVIGGYMVFDDYDRVGAFQEAQIGIDAFIGVMTHANKVEVLGRSDNQLFIRRKA